MRERIRPLPAHVRQGENQLVCSCALTLTARASAFSFVINDFLYTFPYTAIFDDYRQRLPVKF